ncbi:AAA family ATPase [Myxococcota bacterium]|nr:AAA family ATPase [Myxococcota bacterium]
MYIHALSLTNVRGFTALEFPLQRPDGSYAGWNVFAGVNGSGKTTLLRAVAWGLMGTTRGNELQNDGELLQKNAKIAEITLDLTVATSPDRGVERVGFAVGVEYRNDQVSLEGPYTLIYGDSGRMWRLLEKSAFYAGYGPFRRLSASTSEAATLMAASGPAPRFATLFREDATLADSTEWLKSLKFKALEGDKSAEALLGQVTDLLNDDFLQQGFRVVKVSSEGVQLSGPGGVELSLHDMSDGYRSALALLIDLLRHMSNTYGALGLVKWSGERLVVPHPGVVLIDEVDAHLHPSWQRRIGFWLKERFPAVQFLVTSHSPLVVQATDPGGLYRLPDPDGGFDALRVPEAERARIVRQTASEILTSDAFGLEHTRSDEAVTEQAEYASLRARDRQRAPMSEAQRARLEELTALYFGADP